MRIKSLQRGDVSFRINSSLISERERYTFQADQRSEVAAAAHGTALLFPETDPSRTELKSRVGRTKERVSVLMVLPPHCPCL